MYLLCVSTCDFSAFQAIPFPALEAIHFPALQTNPRPYLSIYLSICLSIKFYQSIYLYTHNNWTLLEENGMYNV